MRDKKFRTTILLITYGECITIHPLLDRRFKTFLLYRPRLFWPQSSGCAWLTAETLGSTVPTVCLHSIFALVNSPQERRDYQVLPLAIHRRMRSVLQTTLPLWLPPERCSSDQDGDLLWPVWCSISRRKHDMFLGCDFFAVLQTLFVLDDMCFASNSTERGADLQWSRMMRRFPGETRHDPSSGHLPFRGLCSGFCLRESGELKHTLPGAFIVFPHLIRFFPLQGRQGNCFTPSRRRRVSRWWSTCIGVWYTSDNMERKYAFAYRTSKDTVPSTRRSTAKWVVIHATEACIADAIHNLLDLQQWNTGISERKVRISRLGIWLEQQYDERTNMQRRCKVKRSSTDSKRVHSIDTGQWESTTRWHALEFHAEWMEWGEVLGR